VSIGLAVISYFAIQFLDNSNNTISLDPISIALAVLIGGIVTSVIASLFNRSESKLNNNSTDSTEGELTTLYVGNLPYRANEEAVKVYFQDYTQVQSVRLMKDKRTGKRKGYGFVEVIDSDVTEAIESLNDSVFQDRTLKVRHAKDKVTHS
jgi:RNA recognition motif-containing protein